MFQRILALLLAWAVCPAGAVTISRYELSGNCVDCAAAAGTDTWQVTAVLELRDYLSGAPLERDAFESFSYSGSNLVNPFRVDRASWDAGRARVLNGVFGTGPDAPFTLNLRLLDAPTQLWSCTAAGLAVARSPQACRQTDDLVLRVAGNGGWSFGAPPKDTGVGMTSNDGTVPEPGTIFVLALGVGLLAASARRGQR